jgi:hypothetical protein
MGGILMESAIITYGIVIVVTVLALAWEILALRIDKHNSKYKQYDLDAAGNLINKEDK